MIELNILKDGKRHAVTVSYDDGDPRDRRLISIFNEYGIRGTFHLNSSRYAAPNPAIPREEVPILYKGHEIACHGVRHSSLAYLNATGVLHEILADRVALEKLAGYPVRGHSYANGSYTPDVIAAMRTCGIVYSRTTRDTHGFAFPLEPLEWHPTTHQRAAVEYAKTFMQALDGYYSGPKLLYVWGHSHEFEGSMKWADIEEFSKIVSGDDRIWYATNIELYDYMCAQNALVLSADHTMVYNPSARRVWFSCDGQVCSVGGGEIWRK